MKLKHCNITKILNIMLSVIILLLMLGCSSQDIPIYLQSENKYSSNNQDDGTPEYIAWVCADAYMRMVNGDLEFEEGFKIHLNYANSSIYDKFVSIKSEYLNQISDTRDYMQANKISISAIKFSQEFENDDGTVTIYRIHYFDDRNELYFKQDFINESGQWKIKSDNITDPFKFKEKFLFWYL